MKYDQIRALYNAKKDIAVTVKLDINQGTNPKSEHDRLVLKNMVGAAKKRLEEEFDKRRAAPVIENLEKAAAQIEFTRNEKGLVLFAAEDYSESVALPFAVGNKVKLSDHFATRTLLRALNQTEHYYILVVSQSEVRLLECYNQSLLKEHAGSFPFNNETHFETDRLKSSFASSQDKLSQTFFKQAEEEFSKLYNDSPLPVIVAGPEEAIANYEAIESQGKLMIGKIRGNYDTHNGAQVNDLLEKGYALVAAYKKEKAENSLVDMETAQSKNLLEFDLNNIYHFAKVGQIAELIVDEDYYQRAVIDENDVLFFTKDKEGTVLDDAVNYIVHLVKQTGGDIVFLPPYSIDSEHRMAAILRWR